MMIYQNHFQYSGETLSDWESLSDFVFLVFAMKYNQFRIGLVRFAVAFSHSEKPRFLVMVFLVFRSPKTALNPTRNSPASLMLFGNLHKLSPVTIEFVNGLQMRFA